MKKLLFVSLMMVVPTYTLADCWRPGCGYREYYESRRARPTDRYDRGESYREREDRYIYNRQRGYNDDDPRGYRRYQYRYNEDGRNYYKDR